MTIYYLLERKPEPDGRDWFYIHEVSSCLPDIEKTKIQLKSNGFEKLYILKLIKR